MDTNENEDEMVSDNKNETIDELYYFFISTEIDGINFDVDYLFERYYITSEEIRIMSEEKYQEVKNAEYFFKLPTYRQRALLSIISEQYEISDINKWSESCVKDLCRVIYMDNNLVAFIIITKRTDGNLELSYLYGNNPKKLVYLIYGTANKITANFPNAELIFDTVNTESETIARKLFPNARHISIYEAEI